MTKKKQKSVENFTHESDKRKNIPTAEYENLMHDEDKKPIKLKYPRNPDLDPQLVWRGKDNQDWSDLVVNAPPLYIQEKINPKHIIDDLMRQSKKRSDEKAQQKAPDLFANMFDGNLDSEVKTEFYAHDQNWTNRMILGDSLQVMASLAEREGLRGQVQCIYFDPPYGIKFGSNWQLSTQSREVSDSKENISREAEMVKAFRDTWSEGVHSYLTYIRDRLVVARDLLNENGSIFVQIGDENVHRVRVIMDEVFGDNNFISSIAFQKTGQSGSIRKNSVVDHLLWYGKTDKTKINPVYISENFNPRVHKDYKFIGFKDGTSRSMSEAEKNNQIALPKGAMPFASVAVNSNGRSKNTDQEVTINGKSYKCPSTRHWSTNPEKIEAVAKYGYIEVHGSSPRRKDYFHHRPGKLVTNIWADAMGAQDQVYVVQTNEKIVARCLTLATSPGDLVLDPTCGSGTTAKVAEQYGRRWITIDTSRVALTLARTRVVSAEMPFYILRDSKEGQKKESEISGKISSEEFTKNNIRQGFVYERSPKISLKTIADNEELGIIWENYQETLESLRQQLNSALSQNWQEWEIPREAKAGWPDGAKAAHAKWWEQRNARQTEIDDSIERNAETEYLYDRPYVDNSKVRVAGPFTVESLSPHKVIAVDDDGEFLDNANAIDGLRAAPDQSDDEIDFGNVILEHLRTAGVQQAHKEDRIKFTSLNPFPGKFISGDGRYMESDSENATQKSAAILIGPEYGTLGRADIVAAAREARDLQFDVLVCCAFNYDAHSSKINQLADLPILKARMNPDLHMADELKNTGSGNLFVVFGEPDIDLIDAEDGKIKIKINGVDVFHPSKGEVVSGGPESIVAWFIDTDYNEESFFVRQAYFLGANDPYKQLKSALKAEIDEEAWESLYRDISHPFPKPETGRISVKVINHLGDEVMKVFKLD